MCRITCTILFIASILTMFVISTTVLITYIKLSQYDRATCVNLTNVSVSCNIFRYYHCSGYTLNKVKLSYLAYPYMLAYTSEDECNRWILSLSNNTYTCYIDDPGSNVGYTELLTKIMIWYAVIFGISVILGVLVTVICCCRCC